MDADFTLLSESAIGSPAAFSTAVKPPLAAQKVLEPNKQSDNITGRLALDTPESPVNGSNGEVSREDPITTDASRTEQPSLAESSVGILDLDAIQSDNSASQLFLTSPLDFHSLHLRLSPSLSIASTHASVQPRSSYIQPQSSSEHKPPPQPFAEAKTPFQPPKPPSQPSFEPTSESRSPFQPSSELRPSSLQPSTTGTARTQESTSSGPSEKRTRIPMPARVKSPRKYVASSSNIPLSPTRGFAPKSPRRTDIPQIAVTTPEMDAKTHILSNGTRNTERPLLDTKPVVISNGTGDTEMPLNEGSAVANQTPLSVSQASPALANSLSSSYFKQQMSLGSSFGLPSELLGSLSGSSQFGSDSEGDTVQSALASALAGLADGSGVLSAEASLQDVPSLSLSGQSLPYDHELPEATPSPAHRESVGVSGVSVESPSASMEGLPSTYLHPQDSTYGNDTSTDVTSFSFNTDTRQDLVVASETTLVSSSLADSLTEFAGILGKEDGQEGEGPDGQEGEGLGTQEGEGLGTQEGEGPVMENGDSGMYNPFDSDDDGVGLQQPFQFDEQNSSSFLAQLEKDEEDLKKFNNSSQLQSFGTPSYVGSGSIAESAGEGSLSSYFVKKSDILGDLTAVKLPPQERPHFSDTSSHIITSPHDLMETTPPSTGANIAKATPIRTTDLNETHDVATGPTGVRSNASLDTLSPELGEVTPLPAQFTVPKFTLGDTLSPSQVGVAGLASPVVTNVSEERISVEEASDSVSSASPTSLATPTSTVPITGTKAPPTTVPPTSGRVAPPTTGITATPTSIATPTPIASTDTPTSATSLTPLITPTSTTSATPITPPTPVTTTPTSLARGTAPKQHSPLLVKHTGRYTPIKTPVLSPPSATYSMGGGGGGAKSDANLLQDMQDRLAKFREELENSQISTEALLGRQSSNGVLAGTSGTDSRPFGTATPTVSYPVASATPTVSRPVVTATPTVSHPVVKALSHPVASATPTVPHSTPSITTATPTVSHPVVKALSHPVASATPTVPHPAPSITTATPTVSRPTPITPPHTTVAPLLVFAKTQEQVTSSQKHSPKLAGKVIESHSISDAQKNLVESSIIFSSLSSQESSTTSLPIPSKASNASSSSVGRGTPPSPPSITPSSHSTPTSSPIPRSPGTPSPIPRSPGTPSPTPRSPGTPSPTPQSPSPTPQSPTTPSPTADIAVPLTFLPARVSNSEQPLLSTSSLSSLASSGTSAPPRPHSTTVPSAEGQSEALRTSSVPVLTSFSTSVPPRPHSSTVPSAEGQSEALRTSSVPVLTSFSTSAPLRCVPSAEGQSEGLRTTSVPILTSFSTFAPPKRVSSAEGQSEAPSTSSLSVLTTSAPHTTTVSSEEDPSSTTHYSTKLSEQLARARELFRNLEKMEQAFAESRKHLLMASRDPRSSSSGHAHMTYTSPPLSTSLATASSVSLSPKRTGPREVPPTPPPSSSSGTHHVTFASPPSFVTTPTFDRDHTSLNAVPTPISDRPVVTTPISDRPHASHPAVTTPISDRPHASHPAVTTPISQWIQSSSERIGADSFPQIQSSLGLVGADSFQSSLGPESFPQIPASPRRAGTNSSLLDPASIQVPGTHTMSEVCCIGSLLEDHFMVTNTSERWLELRCAVCRVECEGVLVMGEGGGREEEEEVVFSVPERSFVSPNQSEPIKVTFHPAQSGSYEAVLSIQAHTMLAGMGITSTPGAQDKESSLLAQTLVLKAAAEDPQVELSAQAASGDLLDFGVLVGGANVAMSLELSNKGQSTVPLQISIASDNPPNKMYFSFKPLPTPLLPSSSSSSHIPTPSLHPHTLSLSLPPPPPSLRPHPHSVQICFTAPPKFHSGEGSDFEPPEVISARLEVAVSGLQARPLQIVRLQATVGVARLNVPRALQAISLSCPVGKAVTRDIPVKNMGNIPLHVRLQVGGADPSHFTVTPTTLSIAPQEGSKLSVCFDPPTAPLISEGQIDFHVEPGGPKYELKLRGTATAPPTPTKGMLSCSKYAMYWGGVTLGDSKQIKVLLHNSFPTAIPLRLSIRHPHSPFQLEDKDVTLPPNQETPVTVTFFPFSVTVSITALDIYDKLHSKKYRIPLCGYGGVSKLEVGGANSTPHGKCCLDMGQVAADQGIKLKVSLYNSGPRAAFVRASCCKLESHTPLPDSHAHLKPSHLVIAPHSTEQLLLFYRPDEAEETKCKLSKSPLAHILLETGDELVRQRLVWGLKGEGTLARVSSDHQDFTRDFTHQEKATAELDLIAFQLDNIDKIFSNHLTPTTITLLGSPSSPHGALPKQSTKPEGSGVDMTPVHPLHPLSPSYTPLATQQSSPAHNHTHIHQQAGHTHIPKAIQQNGHTHIPQPSSPTHKHTHIPPATTVVGHSSSTHSLTPSSVRTKTHKSSPAHKPSPAHSSSSPERSRVYHSSPSHSSTPPLGGWKSSTHHSRILSTPLLNLPVTAASQSSGSFLEVKNPFRNPLHWELSSSVLPFYKETRASKPVKTSHQIFTLQSTSGTIPSESSQKLRVTFRPHDKGLFSQVWTLKVSGPVNLKSKQYGLTFTGQSVSALPPALSPSNDIFGSPNLISKSHDLISKSHDHNPGSHDLISKSHEHKLGSHDSQKQKQVAQWLYHQTQHSRPGKKTSPTRRTVYLSESQVEFPDTPVGGQSKVKLRLCNRDAATHAIKVLRPTGPFHVEHTSITLGSRYCARLPVLFSPTEPGQFEAILAIHTQSGHQAFTQLRGKTN